VRQEGERERGGETRQRGGKAVGPGLEIAADMFCVVCVPTCVSLRACACVICVCPRACVCVVCAQCAEVSGAGCCRR
jgi:hypothetical protein